MRVGSISDDETRDLSIAKAGSGPTTPWLGYTPGASHALVRSESVIHVLQLSGHSATGAAIAFELPEAARTAQIRGNNWERPQVAGFLGDRNLAAWPLESGIMLAELNKGPLGASASSARILIDGSQSGRPGFSRLRFSVDGRFLVATTTMFGSEAGTRLQVWDLHSTSTLQNLNEVKKATCAILVSTRVGRRDRSETFMFEGRTLRDPCL